MSLVLIKDAYTIDSENLYNVSAKVDGVLVKYGVQCAQTKTDTEIESLMTTLLLAKGHNLEELTPITWE